MTILRLFILIFIVTHMVSSCDDQHVFDEYQTISGTWEVGNKIEFEFPQLDSLQRYNLFINIRNNNDYAYSNLFLITEMNFPNGKTIKDTLEYRMATPDGQWLGTGFSDLKENKLWYKENVLFNESGNYSISIQQAMRKNGQVNGVKSLSGITDVGFRIENTQNTIK